MLMNPFRGPSSAPARRTKRVCMVNGTGLSGISTWAPTAVRIANVAIQNTREPAWSLVRLRYRTARDLVSDIRTSFLRKRDRQTYRIVKKKSIVASQGISAEIPRRNPRSRNENMPVFAVGRLIARMGSGSLCAKRFL